MQLNDDSAEAEHGFVELFAWNGAIGAFWLDGRQLAEWSFDEPDKLLGTSLRVATLDYTGNVAAREIVDELVCDCCQPDRAMTSAGPVVAYRDRTPEEIRDVVVRRHVDGAWADAVAAGADGWHIEGCPVNGPAIAADGEQRRRRVVHGRRRHAAHSVRALDRRRRELRARARPRRRGLVRPSRPRARRRRHGQGHVVARRGRRRDRSRAAHRGARRIARRAARARAQRGRAARRRAADRRRRRRPARRLDEPRRRRHRPRAARRRARRPARIPP